MAAHVDLILRRATLMIAAAFGAVYSAQAEPVRYRLEVTPTGPQAAPSAVMDCREDALCEGRIELLIGKRRQPVTVVALFRGGAAMIKFQTERVALFVGQQQVGLVPLGPSRVAHATWVVNEPTAQALEDRAGVYWRPVIRTPKQLIAEIDIDIKPRN